MSSINGDKARFHRDRKAKIARRARKRKYLAGLREELSKTPASRSSKVTA